MAPCRCRPTSATRRRPKTPSATRPSTPRARAPSPRRPPGCTSTSRCSRQSRTRARSSRRSRCTSAPGPFSRCGSRKSRSTGCTKSATRSLRTPSSGSPGRRVLAVGTTSLRALETAALTGSLEGETDLFVYPGFEFRIVKRLLTNFHLPKSTLLMLACAFGGKERVLNAYHHAVQNEYRFFSYGDAMLIEQMKFEVHNTDWKGAARHPRARARPRRDAGVHAGGHLRRGEGDVARRAARARRADRARQHLPPVAAPRPGCHPGARRPAPLHGLGRADPHRLRRLPGLQPRRLAEDKRRRGPVRIADQRRPPVPDARDSMRIQRR